MSDVQLYPLRNLPGPPLEEQPVVLTIGNFDGVHLGHQQLIRRVVEDARSLQAAGVLMTFQPHPQAVLRSHQVPILSSLALRLKLFAQLGLDAACIVPFTRELADTTAEEFLGRLVISRFQLRKLIVGYDFAFGRNREGTAELLMQAGHTRGFGFEVFPPVTLAGETVSSTRIRGLLQACEFAQAARLLGRPYSVLEPVVEGQRRGRQLGVPTLNQVPEEPLPIPFGVYAVRALAGEQRLGGVANYGIRPTISGVGSGAGSGPTGGPSGGTGGGTASGTAGAPTPVLETHLFDFTGDLYGQLVEVSPVRRLREERKFPSLDALRAQIAVDAEQARAYLLQHPA